VLRIQRVQNARLWKRYCLFREDLTEARGSGGEAGMARRGCGLKLASVPPAPAHASKHTLCAASPDSAATMRTQV
jgi:hypothetical protein